jgi:hypothetical protein
MKGIVVFSMLVSLLSATIASAREPQTSVQERQELLQEQYGMTSIEPIQRAHALPQAKSAGQQNAPSAQEEANQFFEELLIKNRASNHPIAHNGQTLYYFTHIAHYQEGYHSGKRAGNIRVPASVKNVYNVTIVSDPNVSAFMHPIRIGNVESSRRMGEVVNQVEIHGNVTSLFRSVAIGNITVSGDIQSARNMVEINGSVNVW